MNSLGRLVGNLISIELDDDLRLCPVCDKIVGHTNLGKVKNLKQKRKKDGTWYHTSPWGRRIHRLSVGRDKPL